LIQTTIDAKVLKDRSGFLSEIWWSSQRELLRVMAFRTCRKDCGARTPRRASYAASR